MSPLKILFLCTGNSARSILAEYLLRQMGGGRFETWSAGSQPRGEVNPLAVEILRDLYGIDATGARSKSWNELLDVPFDFVITVCDHARETCPLWPAGHPVVAHWGMEDPAAMEGTHEEKREAFRQAASEIQRRLEFFVDIPFEKLDRLRLEEAAGAIGER